MEALAMATKSKPDPRFALESLEFPLIARARNLGLDLESLSGDMGLQMALRDALAREAEGPRAASPERGGKVSEVLRRAGLGKPEPSPSYDAEASILFASILGALVGMGAITLAHKAMAHAAWIALENREAFDDLWEAVMRRKSRADSPLRAHLALLASDPQGEQIRREAERMARLGVERGGAALAYGRLGSSKRR